MKNQSGIKILLFFFCVIVLSNKYCFGGRGGDAAIGGFAGGMVGSVVGNAISKSGERKNFRRAEEEAYRAGEEARKAQDETRKLRREQDVERILQVEKEKNVEIQRLKERLDKAEKKRRDSRSTTTNLLLILVAILGMAVAAFGFMLLRRR
jgi:hypothetical protein